jgi:hypothetical protein
MNTDNVLTSSCRHCRFYDPEGRRGGMCQQLGVPVQAKWTACSLAASPFKTQWEQLDEIVMLEHSLTLSCSDDSRSTQQPMRKQETLATV